MRCGAEDTDESAALGFSEDAPASGVVPETELRALAQRLRSYAARDELAYFLDGDCWATVPIR